MITGKNLKEWGLPEGQIYKTVLSFVNDIGLDLYQLQLKIKDLINNPSNYLDDAMWGATAKLLVPVESRNIKLKDNGCSTVIFGEHIIEQGALEQIRIASRLPISLKSALMPDGHQGYGLPIGGVLATDNVVIPFAVGMDIGCRMHMTITDVPFKSIAGMKDSIIDIVETNTYFGVGSENIKSISHPIVDDERFNIPTVKNLRDNAIKQLGSSGSGNHFVNLGYVICENYGITEPMLAIVSHSGSRGLGSNVAQIYTKIAMDECSLPNEAKYLSWLDLGTVAGQDYWEAMCLCGDYAKACHEIIHFNIVDGLRCNSKCVIQNHHNFAWKEKIVINGKSQEAIVHRKGATPAGEGVVGLIPGSMTTPTYIVEGLGDDNSICSSSHGAGRLMSRTKAKEQLTLSDMNSDLSRSGVHLIGGSLDECSLAYKDIKSVMNEQKSLVKIIGEFTPWIVKMA